MKKRDNYLAFFLTFLVTIQHRLKLEVFLYEIYCKCSGLRHLCLVQGEKAQFSGLNEHFSTMK